MERAESALPTQVIEALRKGIPPQNGVSLYSVGNEQLIEGIKKYLLTGIEDAGIIRFINGSWGAGKTHFFRLLRELAFEEKCLVSSVELNVNDAALNRFEKVFYSILRNVATPSCYEEIGNADAAPFGHVVQDALLHLGAETPPADGQISHEMYDLASQKLYANRTIDIDFKKMIQKYWETFLAEAADPAIQARTRSEILQWFSGEGTVGTYHRGYGVNKMINKDNARPMLQSLSGFVQIAGYRGLVILFDEAEQAYSIMRKSALRDAQNNLLSLINNIEKLRGLFLVYATTPDFFIDPKHGIVTYGALAGRVGKPENRSPYALNVIWNLDAIVPDVSTYQGAARKIRDIYLRAYPGAAEAVPSADRIDEFVAQIYTVHPSMSGIKFWRVMVAALVAHLDDHLGGDVRPTDQVYDNVIDRLRED